MDTGNRKYGLAALLVGGAVTAGEWYVALGAFVLYLAANVYLRVKETLTGEF